MLISFWFLIPFYLLFLRTEWHSAKNKQINTLSSLILTRKYTSRKIFSYLLIDPPANLNSFTAVFVLLSCIFLSFGLSSFCQYVFFSILAHYSYDKIGITCDERAYLQFDFQLAFVYHFHCHFHFVITQCVCVYDVRSPKARSFEYNLGELIRKFSEIFPVGSARRLLSRTFFGDIHIFFSWIL